VPEVGIENRKSSESMEYKPIDSIDFAFVEPRWLEALLLAVNGHPSFDVFGSKLVNAAALYRRSALLEMGGFDEDFFCYVEDVDLGFRLRAKYDAIKGLPKMWAKRKQVQASRVVAIKDIWRILDKRLFPRKLSR
jgi:hypothetical protein